MLRLLLVMAGGAIGAGLRYEVGRLTLHRFGPSYPWGTLSVNLVGGLLMGLLAGVLAHRGGEQVRLFVAVGILGGFTTFSAFSLEAFAMIQRGALAGAAGYALASVAGSVAMLALGLWAARLVA
ncbi:MAG TPA: fluoride efflux transporter CrcB [Allosphingosinicella sp.]|nr:fluoride efflux transporter CrcB [Allosphingosinicella sp.]